VIVHPMAGQHGSRTLGQCGCPARSPKSKEAKHTGARDRRLLRPRRHPGRRIHRRLLTQDTFRRREIGARDRPDSRRTQEPAPRRIPCAVPRPPSRTGLGRRVRRVDRQSEGLPGDILRTIKECRRLTRPTHRNHVRGRDDRGRAIPPVQRSPAPADAPRRTRAPGRRICRSRGAR
jgi:hypothetical protein